MSKKCPNLQCVQIVSKMFPKCVQVCLLCPKCVQTKVKFGHFLDTFDEQKSLLQNVHNLSKMCPKYVQMIGHILDTFRTHHVKKIVGPPNRKRACKYSKIGHIKYEHILDIFWTHFGHTLDTFWTYFGHIFEIFWTHFYGTH